MSTTLPSDVGRGVSQRLRRSVAIDIAIVCSTAAAVAHLVATPDHFVWWPAAGVLFASLGLVQLGYAAALWRFRVTTSVVLAGVWFTVAVIVLYVVSRTIGVPWSPPVPIHGGRWVTGRSILPDGAKYVGPLDTLTVIAEVLMVVTLLGELPSKLRAVTATRLMWIGLGLFGVAMVGVW
jgi:hypothetical protein